MEELEEKCSRCGSKVVTNEYSPEDEPYILRTEYICANCKYYWYEDD